MKIPPTMTDDPAVERNISRSDMDVIYEVLAAMSDIKLVPDIYEDILEVKADITILADDVAVNTSAVQEQLVIAVDSAISANSAKDVAVLASTNASVSATNALTNEDKAEKWATELEDVDVELGKYSAMHWALKAKGFAESGAESISYDGTVSGLTSVNVQGAIDEIDTRLDIISTNVYTKQEVMESLPNIGLDINANVTVGTGQIAWNTTEGTADLGLYGGSTLQIGQEDIRTVRNATLTAIPNMTVCMFDGTLGNSGRIKVAPFTGLFNQAQYIYGIATQSINAGEDGYITIDGKVRNVDTTGAAVGETWLDGDILYVKPNNAGHLTKVVPADDELKMPIASVIHAHVNGTLEVRVLPFNENMIAKRANKWTTARTITLNGDVAGSVSVDGSVDVTIATTIQPNSVNLGTDTTGNYMVNVTAGSGISVSHTQGEGSTATITNSAPNVTTNITTTHTSTNVVVNSSDGTDGTINSATQTLAGVISAADKTKLDGIEAGATGDQTASEILTLLKTVDGSGSGVDADLLDGQEGAYYLNASNINTGTINDSYLPDTITSDITGNAATATKLATARTINGVSFDGTADIVAPTNLGITAGTTAGPIVTSSTGTNATLPTASGSASGVVTTGNQTWAGVKTFSSNPISTATQSTAVNALTRKDYIDSLDTSNVKLIGNQTIAGVKTFSSTIVGSIGGNAGSATTLTGLTATVAELNKIDGFTGIAIDLNYAKDLRATGVTATEFDYIDGATSNIQIQLNAKAPLANPTFTGTPKIVNDNIASISTSVTDNAIARYDGTTGKLQDSGVFINDIDVYDVDNTGLSISSKAGGKSSIYSYFDASTLEFYSGVTQKTGIVINGQSAVDGSKITFRAGGEERGVIDRNGNLLVTSGTGAIGYGTGSGGTVTQLTSKSTAVTLNRPTGKITMNNASLTSGASVIFGVNNSLVSDIDSVFITGIYNSSTPTIFPDNYRIETSSVRNGLFLVRITNITASTFSDALAIQFTLKKGAIT